MSEAWARGARRRGPRAWGGGPGAGRGGPGRAARPHRRKYAETVTRPPRAATVAPAAARARATRASRTALTTATLTLAATLAACTPATTSEPVEWGTPTDYANELFESTNEQRAQQGLTELVWSDCLETKALPRAQATLTEQSLSHEALYATCNTGAAAGENLTRGPYPPDNVVERWMGSEGHRANIVDPDFTIIGIACVAMSFTDPTREAQAGEEKAGYACSQLFEEAGT